MRKSLADIYAKAFDKKWSQNKCGTHCAYVAAKAVADAVTKRLKRKLAADAKKKDVANSKWVLR